MALAQLSGQGIRKQEAPSSTSVVEGSFSWALIHHFKSADTGPIKAACLHEDQLYITGRKGIVQVDCQTGR
jgi:hypothetical protein